MIACAYFLCTSRLNHAWSCVVGSLAIGQQVHVDHLAPWKFAPTSSASHVNAADVNALQSGAAQARESHHGWPIKYYAAHLAPHRLANAGQLHGIVAARFTPARSAL
jgi:hypothetical protein